MLKKFNKFMQQKIIANYNKIKNKKDYTIEDAAFFTFLDFIYQITFILFCIVGVISLSLFINYEILPLLMELKMKDNDIIKKFIELLEANLRFKGSPKGGGPATPYSEKETKPIYGKSEYDNLDDIEEVEPKNKIKIAKYLKEKGEELDEE